MVQRLTLFLDRRPGLVALLAGGVSATGFAPLGLWPLTLLCLALLIHLLSRRSRVRGAFGIGWLFGLGHFTVGLNWIATAFTFQAAMPAWIGWMAVPLLSLYLALFPALATAGAWWLWRSGLRPEATHRIALYLAPMWVVTEWLRSWLFTGFAWNPLGAVMLPLMTPQALAPYLGTYGVSGIAILIAGSGREYFIRFRGLERGLPRGAILPMAALILLLGMPPFLSLLNAPSASGPDRSTSVTIIQPNIEQGDKWDLAARAENFRKLARLTASDNFGAPRLVLWPEAAVPDYLEDGYPLVWYNEAPALVRARLAGLLGPEDLLLTGAVRLEPNADRSDIDGARNSLFVLDAQGRIGPRYDKAHLVPYGEYLPMRGLLEPLGLSRLAPGAVDFWAGPGARTLDLGRFGRVGVQICYEIIFSGQVVDRANRPDFIFNPSNDAWFGSWGPPQHLAQARLRAIEEGLPVLRATPTGISAVIDARGNILDSLPMHRAGAINTRLPEARAPTFFARHGNVVPVTIALLMLFLFASPALFALVRRRLAR